jgi:hypothetical protein
VEQGFLKAQTIQRGVAHNGQNAAPCDIVDRGFPSTQVEDFLKRKSLAAGSVVGNPPFHLVEMFAHHALLDLHATKVALVFPVARLNAAHRLLKDLPLRGGFGC